MGSAKNYKIVQKTWIDCLSQVFHFVPSIRRLLISFWVFSAIFLPSVFAQDWTQWDLPEGAKLRIGKGSVNNITFSPDGNRFIVESSIGIWIYDAYTGDELDFIAETPNNILGVSPNTSLYVTSDENNIVQLRDLTDKSVKVTLNGETEDIYRIAFSPDMQMLAGTSEEDIHLWDLTTGEHKATLKGHTAWVGTIVFSPDGSTLASESSDNTLQLWDVANATHKTTLSEYARGIRYLMFSPDGNTLISGTSDDIQVWDLDNRQRKYEIRTPSMTSMAISPDGTTIASGGYEGLHLWDVATGTHKVELGGHLGGISSVAFSPDGHTLASGGGDELYLFDVGSGERMLSITGHTTSVYAMAFRPDGNTLATITREKFHFWDPNTGEYKRMIFGGHWSFYYDIAFSPDGNTFATQEVSRLLLWDVESATHIVTLSRFGGSPRQGGGSLTWGSSSIVFSPDGKLLFSGNRYSTAIHIWYGGRTQKSALIGHTEGINSIALNHDGSTLASASNDHTVRLWDVATELNTSTFTGHTGKVFSVAFHPRDNIIASSSEDNTIILWDIATGEPRTIHTEYTDGVSSILFSADGRTLVSSGADYWDDNTVQIWDVASGELITTLTGHTSGTYNIDFSPDGSTLASASSDGTVMLWDYTPYLDTTEEPVQLAEDVNHDGTVDIQDLIHVATQYGQIGDENPADINGDGIVNIADILLVAAALENVNAAPSKYMRPIELLTAVDIQGWLDQARLISNMTPIYQKGIAKLEQILTQLTPRETVLLPNYPNPFNPETWIPYQLAKPADVMFHIYSSDGQLVRTLKLGHQNAGIYQDRTHAAYWDGKNEFGEHVASGVYFYTMTAGNWTATNRMVIRK